MTHAQLIKRLAQMSDDELDDLAVLIDVYAQQRDQETADAIIEMLDPDSVGPIVIPD